MSRLDELKKAVKNDPRGSKKSKKSSSPASFSGLMFSKEYQARKKKK